MAKQSGQSPTADFLVYHTDGTEEIIDIKGMETQQGVMKAEDVLVQIPRTEADLAKPECEVGRHRRLD